jgi:hypothetical protein
MLLTFLSIISCSDGKDPYLHYEIGNNRIFLQNDFNKYIAEDFPLKYAADIDLFFNQIIAEDLHRSDILNEDIGLIVLFEDWEKFTGSYFFHNY